MRPFGHVVRLLVVAVALTLPACQTGPAELTEARRQAIADSVRQVLDEWDAAFREGDSGRLFEFWMDDDDLASYFVGDPALMVSQLSVFATPDAMREAFAAAIEARRKQFTTYDDDYLAVLSEDAVLYAFVGTYAFGDTLGNVTDPLPMSASMIWVRTDEGWEIVHYHQSFNPSS